MWTRSHIYEQDPTSANRRMHMWTRSHICDHISVNKTTHLWTWLFLWCFLPFSRGSSYLTIYFYFALCENRCTNVVVRTSSQTKLAQHSFSSLAINHQETGATIRPSDALRLPLGRGWALDARCRHRRSDRTVSDCINNWADKTQLNKSDWPTAAVNGYDTERRRWWWRCGVCRRASLTAICLPSAQPTRCTISQFPNRDTLLPSGNVPSPIFVSINRRVKFT